MEKKEYLLGKHPHIVEAEVIFCGEDLVISVGGGTKYHTGAVAIAYPSLSNNDATRSITTPSVIAIAGHREDEIARTAAILISKMTRRTVTLAVGLHIDNASPQDIQQLVDNFNSVIQKIIESI